MVKTKDKKLFVQGKNKYQDEKNEGKTPLPIKITNCNKFIIFCCRCFSNRKYRKLLEAGKECVEKDLDIVHLIKSLRIIERTLNINLNMS